MTMTKSETQRAELAELMIAEGGKIEVEVGNKAGRVPYLTLKKFAFDNGYELEKLDVGLWTVTATDASESEAEVAELAEALADEQDDIDEEADAIADVLAEDEEYEDAMDEQDEDAEVAEELEAVA